METCSSTDSRARQGALRSSSQCPTPTLGALPTHELVCRYRSLPGYALGSGHHPDVSPSVSSCFFFDSEWHYLLHPLMSFSRQEDRGPFLRPFSRSWIDSPPGVVADANRTGRGKNKKNKHCALRIGPRATCSFMRERPPSSSPPSVVTVRCPRRS